MSSSLFARLFVALLLASPIWSQAEAEDGTEPTPTEEQKDTPQPTNESIEGSF